MFDELKKYKQSDRFIFSQKDNLREVCNAPPDKSGLYIVYALGAGKIELIYIGRSGRINNKGEIIIRKAGLGGIKDRIVNGHQFGKIPRRLSWARQMKKENIQALQIFWYVTHSDAYVDCPRALENQLLQKHLVLFGYLPKWNIVL